MTSVHRHGCSLAVCLLFFDKLVAEFSTRKEAEKA